MTTFIGKNNIAPLTRTTPYNEKMLVRDEKMKNLYLPLTSTVILKRKQEMLYVLLNLENNLTIDTLVRSNAYSSAIAQNGLDATKQQAPNGIFKIDDFPNFQTRLANGQLEKPLATTTLKFEIGDKTFAELFVVLKKLTGLIIGLHFMRNNSVVIDTTVASYIFHT